MTASTATRYESSSSKAYGSANLFATANGGTISENDFLQAMNDARSSKHSPDANRADRPTDADGNEQHLHHTDPSMFDFNSPARTDSPFQSQFSPHGGTGNMPGWASDINFQPLSPPDSASLDHKTWDYPFPSYPTPSNILTSIQNSNSRSHYGQVTPPDDEHDGNSFLDRPLREEQSDSVDPQRPSDSTTSTGRKRSRTGSGNVTSKDASPAKRSRKYNSRNAAAAVDASPATNRVEDVKRSKFLERNRVAASKCRQKKKEWTHNLEKRAREMQKNNASMRMLADSLRQEILFLKGEMLKHSSCECTQIQQFMKDHSNHLSHESVPRVLTDLTDDTADGLLKTERESSSGLGDDVADLATVEGRSPTESHLDEDSIGGDDTAERIAADKAAEIAEDESALEALLTSSLQGENEVRVGG